MLKADGPDWQKVLGYVESVFRHFEMWSQFVSFNVNLFHDCGCSWRTESLFATRGSSAHYELVSQAIWRFSDFILRTNTKSVTQKRLFSNTQMKESKPWECFLFFNYFFLHTIYSDLNGCWVIIHKTQKFVRFEIRSPEYKLNSYFHIC